MMLEPHVDGLSQFAISSGGFWVPHREAPPKPPPVQTVSTQALPDFLNVESHAHSQVLAVQSFSTLQFSSACKDVSSPQLDALFTGGVTEVVWHANGRQVQEYPCGSLPVQPTFGSIHVPKQH